MTNSFPKQKLPRSKKDEDWGKQVADALSSFASFSASRRHDIVEWFEAYEGKLDETSYNYVTNPYNTAKQEYTKFPARIRNYNIIKPVIDLFVGEKSKRPFSLGVIARNEDAYDKKEEDVYNQVLEAVKSKFMFQLQQQGVQVEEGEDVDIPAVTEAAKSGFKDQRAIMGHNALEFLWDYLDLEEQFQKAFMDWCVTGMVYSEKDNRFNDIDYQIVSPLDIDYDKNPDLSFIEDADWVIRRRTMSVNTVIDKFHDLLTDEEVGSLEDPTQGMDIAFTLDFMTSEDQGDSNKDREIEVIRYVWKSLRKVGILTYPDEFGQEQKTEVDETYTADTEAGESIAWEWHNEGWEIYKIDGRIYKGLRPLDVQRRDMQNPSKCKLPFNGRVLASRYADNFSIVSLGLPYQTLYNIYHYRLELAIAKNKDKIILAEINTVPKHHGWDEDKFMYYADAAGYMWIDSTAEGKNNRPVNFNQFQVLDASLAQSISLYFELLRTIKAEWEESIGVTPQRKGQVANSAGKGTTDRAVFQSSIITDEFFRKFEKWQEKELQGLLDLSKFAWADGKRLNFLNSDMKQVMMEIIPEDYTDTEFAVFVRNSSKEQQKVDQLRAIIPQYAQQKGAKLSTMAEILDNDNFANLKAKVEEFEAKQEQAEQAAAQQQSEFQKEQIAMAQQQKAAEQMFTADENQKDRELQLQLKLLDLEGSADTDGDGVIDALEQERVQIETNKVQNAKTTKEKEIAQKDRASLMDAASKRYVADTNLEIAKENKQSHEVSKNKKKS